MRNFSLQPIALGIRVIRVFGNAIEIDLKKGVPVPEISGSEVIPIIRIFNSWKAQV